MPHCSMSCRAFAARIPIAIAFLAAFIAGASFRAAPPSPEDLRKLSIDELGRIQAATVSERPEAAAPAAVIFVFDEFFVADGLTATHGAKFEHNIAGPGFSRPAQFDPEDVIAHEAGDRETVGRAAAVLTEAV